MITLSLKPEMGVTIGHVPLKKLKSRPYAIQFLVF